MAHPTRAAAVDIGTNSVLLVAAEGPRHAPRVLDERATITRLGRGVDRTRWLEQGAVERTLACLEDYSRRLDRLGIERRDAVCTSAARDAENGEGFLDRAAVALGVRPRIIAGEHEARLAFSGSTMGLDLGGAVTVLDVGGGSTEVIVGIAGASPASASSLDVGSVRLTERYLASDPPKADELAQLRDDVLAAFRTVEEPPSGGTFVGVAGTVTTIAAIERSLERYDASVIHGARLARASLRALVERLVRLSTEDRGRIPGLEPKRADVIVAGAIIVEEALGWAGAQELVVSDRGVRWGLLAQLL